MGGIKLVWEGGLVKFVMTNICNSSHQPMKLLFSFVLTTSLAFTLSAQQPVSAVESVTMTSFNAVPRDRQVLLSWNPETSDVKAYEVEKSKNGTDYIPFGKMQGATAVTEFIETDFMPYEGLSYYRLKLTNNDGTVSYSNVVPVKFDLAGNPTSPVPATASNTNDNTGDKSILVIVRSAAGDEYYSKVSVTSAGDPVECFNPDPNLVHGTYTIVGCSEQDLYSKQLVVQ